MAILANPNPIFQPAMRIISAITNANPAAVTTTFAHQYTSGIVARLNVPTGFGMIQANQLYGPICVTGATTFTIDIDTTAFDPLLVTTSIDTTDGSGNASGTITGTWGLQGLGQIFTIGTQVFQVVSLSGALNTTGTGTGTMNMTTGAYTFAGCAINSSIYWNPVAYPANQQYPTVTAIGEINLDSNAPERNILPFNAI